MPPLTPEQKQELYLYIQHVFIGTDHINTKYTAYGLKQRFSRKYFYITQEQFIEAMIDAGFKAKLIDNGDAHFNISDYSLFGDM